MREICIPIPEIVGGLPVEIEIKSAGNDKSILYRIVSFPFASRKEQTENKHKESASSVQISELKNTIETYDNAWQLIQIFAPLNNSNYIQVLFRKK